MAKLLHIIATPRAEESRTLKVSKVFLQTFKDNNPANKIDELNLYKEKLPELTAKRVDGKYVLLMGKELSPPLKAQWKEIIAQTERFLSADRYLISAPMWNFSIPYTLKHYIDVIVQPKYLFQYTEKGPEGLAKNKKMAIITSRGGDYSADSPFHSYDYQEQYLRTIFGFVGITDIAFINAQPMDVQGLQIQEEKIKQAQSIAKKAAENF